MSEYFSEWKSSGERVKLELGKSKNEPINLRHVGKSKVG